MRFASERAQVMAVQTFVADSLASVTSEGAGADPL